MESKLMTTSEPTTGEIVRALRYCGSDEANCAECEYTCIDKSGECFMQLSNEAADRLESQAAYIKELEEALKPLIPIVANQRNEIIVLTARAERAEATMKAIVDVIDSGSVVCTICANRVGWDTCKPCKFKLRGQPQDGEGK